MHVRLRWPVLSGLMILGVLWMVGTGSSPAEPVVRDPGAMPVSAVVKQPGSAPLVIDETPQPFAPKHPQTEEQRHRLHALTLYATGRMLEQQKNYAGALRHYQRALRYDPKSLTAGRAIIPLANRLKRPAEAFRYALKVVELEDADPLLLEGLADYLAGEGKLKRAVTLYEKALAAQPNKKNKSNAVKLHIKMGGLYNLIDQYDKAADNFSRVIDALENPKKFGLDEALRNKILGKPASTYNLFGECFVLADQPEKAIAAFKKANQFESSKGLLGYHMAQAHACSGKHEKAIAELQVYFDEKLTSEGTSPYRLLADILSDLDKEDELIKRLEKLHASDADNTPLGYFLAEKYHQAKQFHKAQALYVKLIKKTPTLTAYKSLVDIYRQTKQPKQLLKVLGEAVVKTGSLDLLGEEIVAVTNDAALVDTLIKTARKLVRTDSKQPAYEIQLAAALLALEGRQFEAAREFFDMAISSRPKEATDLLRTWGAGLLLADQFAEAARVFQRAIDKKVSPKDDAVFYYFLAGALELDGKTEKALAAAGKAAELKKDSPLFLSRRPWVLYHAKRYNEAIKAYLELIEKLDSDHHTPAVREVMRETRLVLSHLYVLEKNIPEAEEWLEQVLDEFPDDISAMNDLGYLWAEEDKNLQRAFVMIQKAVEAEPENDAYRDSLGWVLYRLKRYQEAVTELEKAAACDQPDPVILDHLGDAYLSANQPKKAKEAWRRSAKAFRKDGQEDEAKKAEAKIKGK